MSYRLVLNKYRSPSTQTTEYIISINNGGLVFFTTESHAWGLNFVSEEEAQKFLEFCSVCINTV